MHWFTTFSDISWTAETLRTYTICIMYRLTFNANLLVLNAISNYSVQRLDDLKLFNFFYFLCVFDYFDNSVVNVNVIYRKVWRERKNQQDATIRYVLSTSVSTCFGHHYAHLQENKDRVTVFGVLLWFCWMWLVAVVGRCVVARNMLRQKLIINV